MTVDRRSSISQSMIIYDIDNFDIIIRIAVYNFRERLMKSENTVIGAIINSMFFQCVALHSEVGIKYDFNLVIHIPRLIIPTMFYVQICIYIYIYIIPCSMELYSEIND